MTRGGDKVTLPETLASPVRPAGVDWSFHTWLEPGDYAVEDDVVDNYGGVLFVTDGPTPGEWAIAHENMREEVST